MTTVRIVAVNGKFAGYGPTAAPVERPTSSVSPDIEKTKGTVRSIRLSRDGATVDRQRHGSTLAEAAAVVAEHHPQLDVTTR